MNIKLLEAIARWLEGGAKHERISFDMSKGVYVATGEELDESPEHLRQCNTSCCIAGAAVTFSHKDDVGYLQEILQGADSDTEYGDDGFVSYGLQAPWWRVSAEAQALLQLDDKTAFRLFTPDCAFGGNLSDYNDPKRAARVIRNLIATGDVDWEATRHETESA